MSAVVLVRMLAWTAVLAVCLAAVLFGQSARSAPRGRNRPTAGRRLGLALSMSGPWLVVAGAASWAIGTGAWLPAAVIGAGGVVVVSITGFVLTPG